MELTLNAGEANAFCRTTTARAPADYDASQGGCWALGIPLFWHNACVGYSIIGSGSKKMAYEDIANAMSLAFTRWTGATCPTDGSGRSRTSIDVRDLGPAGCDKIGYVSGAANQNVILFRDDSWNYPPQVLGLTTVVYAPETGEIYGADMEINMFDMEPLWTQYDQPTPDDAYDFLAVVTHEAGHFLGMGHSDVPTATMFADYEKGQNYQRYLSPDDVAGICSVYLPDGNRAVLNGKIAQGPQCDPTPRGGYSPDCQKKPTGCAGSSSSTSPRLPSRDPADLAWVVGAVLAGLLWRHRSARARPK
jgi:hypothetical protein